MGTTASVVQRNQDALVRIDAGDTCPLDDLVRQFSPLVSGAARRILGNTADVEDVKQETWMSLLAKAGTIRHPECLAAWLWTTSTHHALQLARRRSRDVATDPVALSCSDQGDEDETADHLLAEEARAVVDEALNSLRPLERELIELLFAGSDLPYAEIAARAGRPIGSLGPTRRRILDKLKHLEAVAALATTGEPWRGATRRGPVDACDRLAG